MSQNRAETPMNLWSMAKEFHDDACALMKADQSTLIGFASMPTFYLLSHGIELLLKAYLRSTGRRALYLKRLGHDMLKCLRRAEQAGLSHYVRLDTKERVVLKVVNTYYRAKELEYVVTQGQMTLPDVRELESVFEKLLRGTRQVCLQATVQEREAGAAVGRPG